MVHVDKLKLIHTKPGLEESVDPGEVDPPIDQTEISVASSPVSPPTYMCGSPTIGLLPTHPNLKLSYWESVRGCKRSHCSAQLTSAAPLFPSLPKSNS